MGWIGVDLDGTLATYGKFQGHNHIGEPILPMIERVKRWVNEGRDVRIFTARVSGTQGDGAIVFNKDGTFSNQSKEEAIKVIQDWSEKHIGLRLPVTNEKDYAMDELWDDRAVQVEMNTGRLIGKSTRGLGE